MSMRAGYISCVPGLSLVYFMKHKFKFCKNSENLHTNNRLYIH